METIDARFLSLVPDENERLRLAELLRLGAAFKSQQRGRKRGFLHQYLTKLVASMSRPVTFDNLLVMLEIAASQRDMLGAAVSPIEKVNRVWGLVTYHHPNRGSIKVTFGTLRNKFTSAKKNAFTGFDNP